MMLFALLLQAVPAAPPISIRPERLALARRLVAKGALATLMPLMVSKDLLELSTEDKTLTDAQQVQVVDIGQRVAETKRAALIEAFAHGYAERLSLGDLKVLVAAADRVEAARKRAADLPVTMQAMLATGQIDLKKETAAATCAEAHLLCGRE